MSGPIIPPDVLLVLVRPDSTFDERKDAAFALAEASWSRGWDDCAAQVSELLAPQGIEVPKPPRAVRLS